MLGGVIISKLCSDDMSKPSPRILFLLQIIHRNNAYIRLILLQAMIIACVVLEESTEPMWVYDVVGRKVENQGLSVGICMARVGQRVTWRVTVM